MTYPEYMTSDMWAQLRMDAIRRDGYKCRCCHKQCDENGVGLQAHHLQYPKDFKDDCLANVITLCKSHHASRHGFKNQCRHISEGIDAVMARFDTAFERGRRES